MDGDNPPSICMTSLSSSEDFVTLNPEDIDDLKSLVPVSNSFEDFQTLNEDCDEGILGQNLHAVEAIGHPFEIMGIENTWNEDNSFASASAGDFPIPLPPPGGFDGIGCLEDSDVQTSSHHGPFQESDLGNLFSNESHTSEDVRDAAAVPGVCGLHNLGNTCFMGAGLQCLAASPALMHFFLSRPVADKDSTRSLTDQFALLVHKVWSGQLSVLRPDEFKQALGVNHAQFKDYRQHDCQEFLALLLDNLHEQLNLAGCCSGGGGGTAPPTPPTPCSHSSSSESSGGETFRLRPVPGDLAPFRDPMEADDGDRPPEKNEMATRYNNNVPQCFRGLEDILKDAKTSNVNVLVTEQEINNEIRFDSEKFPKHENTRRRDPLENPNLTEFHNFDGKTVSVKRIKESNLLHRGDPPSPGGGEETDQCFNNIKRMRLEEDADDKNHRMERLRTGGGGEEGVMAAQCSSRPGRLAPSTEDELQADKYWDKHLASNQSVVVDTFQGQFKSTVVCAGCGHVSVTYEPFMYLSVPVPHAMERQICVTFVPWNSRECTQYLLTLNKQDKVLKLREELFKTMGCDGGQCVALAEVLDGHMARQLDESSLLRYVNDTNRSIYAFELLPPPSLPGAGGDGLPDPQPTPVPPCGERGDGWKSCAICLEEMETDVRRHKSCSCVLCESCIETSCKHHGDDSLPCPVCGMVVRPETEFVPIDSAGGDVGATIRMLNVPVVFRSDADGDGNNNKKTMKLFGHPHLVRLPNRLMGEDLHRAVSRLVPYCAAYTLLFVDGQGYHCSRCMYTMHCRGCRVPQDGEVLLQTGDTLAVRLSEPVEPIPTLQHPSMKARRSSEPLSLYDCLQAFSESERLDEHNPWYCPMCQKNQCATKTLSVWRYPDFLIVYLKRFIFHDGVSVKLDNKVTFPLTGLKFNPPSTLHQGSPYAYNLYACVCHFGGPTAGHYTAYTKHPRSGEWHYFNDEVVTRQKPQEEDYNNGYVLFYQRQGVSFELSIPKLLAVEDSSKPNIDQLILDLDSSVEQDWQQEHLAHGSAGAS